MKQIKINNPSSYKSVEVSASIAKSPDSCESEILLSQNGSTTSGSCGVDHHAS
jgi:hypothetical protein